MTRTLRCDALRLYAAILIWPAGTLAVRLALPELFTGVQVRLRYPAPSGKLDDALAIFAGNVRAAGLVVGASFLVVVAPAARLALTALVTGLSVINVALVCTVIAADGTRAAAALLPHGPVELLAFTTFGAVFLEARRVHRTVALQQLALTTACGAALLAIAALLEVTPT